MPQYGHTPVVARDDDMWLDAAAGVQSDVDADLRAEAFEVFVAEAARSRLVDRTGDISVRVRSGSALRGRAFEAGFVARVDGHLVLITADRRAMLVPVGAVVTLTGASGSLRDEGAPARSLASVLRDCWHAGDVVRVLCADGRWLSGRLTVVAADHADLAGADGATTVAYAGAEAWELPAPPAD